VKTHIVHLLAAAALLSTAACGREGVEITRSTTSPTPAPTTPVAQPSSTVGVVVSGTISAIDTVARTLVVNGSTVAVPASARIDGGRDGAVTFADLKVGWQVTIRASQSGSVITATDLVVNLRGNTPVEIEGAVAALAGSCPSVTFTVGTAAVSTTASTSFDGSCGRLANGLLVVVDGNLGSGASIAATRVSIRSEGK
jgi:hypothetical protein